MAPNTSRFRPAAALFALLAVLAAVVPRTAAALSLEQYFFELSDRERGAYITGFLDFFVRDSARDAGYRGCVETLGPARLHDALARLVQRDPTFLPYDAMSWLLYEASRLCNQKVPREPPKPPPPQLAAKAEPPAPVASLPPAPVQPPAVDPGAPAAARVPQPGSSFEVLPALIVGLAVMVTGLAWYVRRHGAPGRLGQALTRRGLRRTAHSPE